MPTYKIHDDNSDEWLSLAQGPRGVPGGPFAVGGTPAVRDIAVVTAADPLTVQWAPQSTVSVDSFGALGDNSTDDSAAIQIAFDAIAASGGRLVFRPGATYKIGPTWPTYTPGGKRVIIDGNGATIRWLDASTTKLFEVVSASDQILRITNFKFVGAGVSSGDVGLRMVNCKETLVDHCSFSTCQIGLDLVNDGNVADPWTEQNTFTDLRFTTCGTGVKMSRENSGNASMAGNRFHDLVVSNTATHFHVTSNMSFYGGLVDGFVFFLSQSGSPIGVDIDGNAHGTRFQGRMEESGDGSPIAFRFSAATTPRSTSIHVMLTGNGFVDPPIVNNSTNPGPDVVEVYGSGAGSSARTGLTRPALIVDAKGDLLVGTADNTLARLAVGTTNGHALTVDSAETVGVKWAEPHLLTSPNSTVYRIVVDNDGNLSTEAV
jgi:hypothetical protein